MGLLGLEPDLEEAVATPLPPHSFGLEAMDGKGSVIGCVQLVHTPNIRLGES